MDLASLVLDQELLFSAAFLTTSLVFLSLPLLQILLLSFQGVLKKQTLRAECAALPDFFNGHFKKCGSPSEIFFLNPQFSRWIYRPLKRDLLDNRLKK